MSPTRWGVCETCETPVRIKNDGDPYKHPCDKPVQFDECEACGKRVALDGDGVMVKHFRDPRNPDSVCDGSPVEGYEKSLASEEYDASVGDDPLFDAWIAAGLVVPGDSAETHRRMLAGKPCHNGATCPYCHPKPVSEPPATVVKMDDTKPDPFDTPADVKPPEPETNVSGQPEPARDQWGRYLLPHPVTGLYSDGKEKPNRRNGWMRATTFAKLAADTFSLTRYNERLTLLGATLRPDVVALAHGKHVKRDNKELNRLVTEVKETAGAKVAANIGTAVHSFTEQVDAGVMKPEEVPVSYIPHVVNYLEELKRNGLSVVPGLIERTTLVDEWGKVIVGTFDRVLYHRPSGTYLIGDLKTGETLDWGKMEIAVQLSLYAHGINAHGVFDWNTGTWRRTDADEDLPRINVRTDFGVVMHLPIQGPNAGVCTMRRVNLAAGWDAAATSASVDTSRKRDDYMDADFSLPAAPYVPETPSVLPPTEPIPWEYLFEHVRNKAEASTLYKQAKEEGVDRMELQRLVGLAQQRLRDPRVSG